MLNDEKLIELVGQHSVLYNIGDPKYMDPRYKMSIWDEIGKNLGTTGAACKNRWINIRDHFRRLLSKRNTTGFLAVKSLKKYKYEKGLQFLLPYINERKPISNLNLKSFEEDYEIIPKNEPEEPENSNPEPEILQTSSEAQPTSIPNVENPKRKFLKRKNASDSPSSVLMKCTMDKNKTDEEKTISDIDTFLASIGTTLKQFPPYYKHVAKGQIFQIVHDLEFQVMQNQASEASHSQTNSAFSSPIHSPDIHITTFPEEPPQPQSFPEG